MDLLFLSTLLKLAPCLLSDWVLLKVKFEPLFGYLVDWFEDQVMDL